MYVIFTRLPLSLEIIVYSVLSEYPCLLLCLQLTVGCHQCIFVVVIQQIIAFPNIDKENSVLHDVHFIRDQLYLPHFFKVLMLRVCCVHVVCLHSSIAYNMLEVLSKFKNRDTDTVNIGDQGDKIVKQAAPSSTVSVSVTWC